RVLCCIAASGRQKRRRSAFELSRHPSHADLRVDARLAAGLAAPFAVLRLDAAVFPLSFATLRLSSSMRAISTSMSLDEGTPSLFRALDTRSSKMFSSLSHWPEARDEMSVAMVAIRLVASEIFSSAAACVLR